jgi:hypothetical protein
MPKPQTFLLLKLAVYRHLDHSSARHLNFLHLPKQRTVKPDH